MGTLSPPRYDPYQASYYNRGQREPLAGGNIDIGPLLPLEGVDGGLLAERRPCRWRRQRITRLTVGWRPLDQWVAYQDSDVHHTDLSRVDSIASGVKK